MCQRVIDYFNDKISNCVIPGITITIRTIRNPNCYTSRCRARLYLHYYELEGNIKCYNLKWISLSPDTNPTDCFDITNSHWYGGGQTAEFAWPLEKGGHNFQPFITGKVEQNEWGNVLKRYFIGSKGK